MGEKHFRGKLHIILFGILSSAWLLCFGLPLLLLLTLIIGRRGKSLIIFRGQNACHSAESGLNDREGAAEESRLAVKAALTIGSQLAKKKEEEEAGNHLKAN